MFDKALEAVLGWEGGYSNDPDDTGGATRYGITIGTLEMWRGEPLTPEDVQNLSLDEARTIYRENYWSRCKCDEMPPGLALVVFDAGVNHGPAGTARLLQQALSVNADGILGPQTMGALEGADIDHVIDEFMARRAKLYARLNPKFHLGWYRRLMGMHRRALTL